MRIVSLLPSATEILYALGVGEQVVGVTHECDFPPDVAGKPALIKPRVDPHAPPAEIDRRVSELVAKGESIYAVDADLLESLAPDLIVTQDLCHVCAASPGDLAMALSRFSRPPRVLALAPHSLEDVWQDIIRVGDATGAMRRGETLASELRAKVRAAECATAQRHTRPRVVCLEWLEPLYVAGHWVPEMVFKAGGHDALAHRGQPSFKVSADDVARSGAEVILVMLCGYDSARNAREFKAYNLPSSWSDLPAIQNRRVFAVDANGYFSRPGPRLADGLELLVHLLQMERVSDCLPEAAYESL
ncbi:MAG: cobalamin-binding protein [Candidatus Acidiferrales bacterium]